MSGKGRVYFDLAQTNGEQAVHNIEQSLTTDVWPEWNVGSAVQHAIEAWHFASRLTPEELQLARVGKIERIVWHRLGDLPGKALDLDTPTF